MDGLKLAGEFMSGFQYRSSRQLMPRHKKTRCKLIGFTNSRIAKWYCPTCDTNFQFGSDNTEEAFCEGMW